MTTKHKAKAYDEALEAPLGMHETIDTNVHWTQYDECTTIVDGKEVKIKLKRQGTASK
jgi:hypothetical protein